MTDAFEVQGDFSPAQTSDFSPAETFVDTAEPVAAELRPGSGTCRAAHDHDAVGTAVPVDVGHRDALHRGGGGRRRSRSGEGDQGGCHRR